MADSRQTMFWRPSPASARDGQSPGTTARRKVSWSRPPPWSEASTGTRIRHPGQTTKWAVTPKVTRGRTGDTAGADEGSSRLASRGGLRPGRAADRVTDQRIPDL